MAIVRFIKHIYSGKYNPAGTILAVAVFSLVLLSCCEVLLVSMRYMGVYPLEVYGTGNHALEQRLNQLDIYCRENGPPRYLFIGNSKVGQGVDPDLVSRSYEGVTGDRLSCVNFGFGGNTSDFLPIILKIIEEDFNPGKIVLDLTGPYQVKTFPHEKSAWLRYRTGDFNISGWMIEHFHFIRVFLRLRHWMEQPAQDYQLKAAIRDRGKVEDIGFTEKRKRELLEKEVSSRNDPKTLAGREGDESEKNRAEEQVFLRIIDLIGPENLVFFELPLSFRITRSLGDFRYRKERSEKISRGNGIPLVRMEDLKQLPLDSWMRDGLHMEKPGIEAFSLWLGEALAEMEMSDQSGKEPGKVKIN